MAPMHIRERGAAAVELALVAPVLLAIMLGIVEFGFAFNFKTQLNNVTQIAARNYAIDSDASKVEPTIRQAVPAGDTRFSNLNIDRKVDGSTAKACSANAGKDVVITVTVRRNSITNFFGTLLDWNYSEKAVARCG